MRAARRSQSVDDKHAHITQRTSRNDRRGFVLTRRGFHRRSLGGLCVEVTVPVSSSFRFSPVGLDDDGPGLCIELVLPIVCPEESCPEEGLGPTACPEEPCPEEGLDAPPVFSAKDSVVVPAKRAIATAAAAILRCILHSLSFADARIKQRADKLEVRYGDAHHAVSSAGFFALASYLAHVREIRSPSWILSI